MANLKNIDMGQADWVTPLMDNLNLVNYNTDWIYVPLTNTTATGLGDYLIVRKTNYHVDIKSQFAVPAAGNITIGIIPTNMLQPDWRFLQGFAAGQSTISITIDENNNVIAHVPTGSEKRTIDVDTTISYTALRVH
ncbi:hypothetical protein [Lactiplantibacillus daowaiensis]|uniref:Uncharacterized protein n=1 Tax=Lactiplantibacillus daowaiensis TaxID=2559918 RepID=A0ABW1RY29_9LACO|nr:hypothetical protein [Lactiplantibacillus daowaiensis]